MTQTMTSSPRINLTLELVENASSLKSLIEMRSEYYAHRSLRDSFGEAVEAASPTGHLAGLVAWIRGDNALAARELSGSKDLHAVIAADAALSVKDWKATLTACDHAGSTEPDLIGSFRVEALVGQDNVDEAAKIATSLNDSTTHGAYAQALVAEAHHEYEKALDYYEKAITNGGDDRKALFRAAQIHDRYGNDETAIELYERCRERMPVIQGCLINLGILYEDSGRLQDAVFCFEEILVIDPNNERARLFQRDVNASFNMTYDEEAERLRDQQMKLLQTKIADFELSVRSRNCLQMMNIHTLGDLVQKSEQELLSYPNFGETSLQEIKEILKAKKIRLGQSLKPGALAQSLGDDDSSEEPDDPVLKTSISSLKLSIRSVKVLETLGVNNLADLMQFTEEQLLAQKNFGKTSIKEIKGKLSEFNLELPTSDKKRSAN